MRIVELAEEISRLAQPLSKYFSDNELTPPNHGPAYCAPETDEYEALLSPLNEVIQEFLQLINGPKKTLTSLLLAHYDLAAYQVALEFGFFEAVPLGKGDSMHLEELARIVDVDKDRVGRIMKFLATQMVFQEIETDVFAHTANSALFATDSDLRAAGLMQSVYLASLLITANSNVLSQVG